MQLNHSFHLILFFILLYYLLIRDFSSTAYSHIFVFARLVLNHTLNHRLTVVGPLTDLL